MALGWIFGILFVVGILVVMAVVYALPTMLLWNWLMPNIFGLKKINFFQAFGLLMLCGFLFGGHGNGGSNSSNSSNMSDSDSDSANIQTQKK